VVGLGGCLVDLAQCRMSELSCNWNCSALGEIPRLKKMRMSCGVSEWWELEVVHKVQVFDERGEHRS
jgi:hypothetical protein